MSRVALVTVLVWTLTPGCASTALNPTSVRETPNPELTTTQLATLYTVDSPEEGMRLVSRGLRPKKGSQMSPAERREEAWKKDELNAYQDTVARHKAIAERAPQWDQKINCKSVVAIVKSGRTNFKRIRGAQLAPRPKRDFLTPLAGHPGPDFRSKKGLTRASKVGRILETDRIWVTGFEEVYVSSDKDSVWQAHEEITRQIWLCLKRLKVHLHPRIKSDGRWKVKVHPTMGSTLSVVNEPRGWPKERVNVGVWSHEMGSNGATASWEVNVTFEGRLPTE